MRIPDFFKRHETSFVTALLLAVILTASSLVLRACDITPVTNVGRYQDPNSGVYLTRLRSDLSVTAVSASNSLAVPSSATAGGDIRGWLYDGKSRQDVVVLITGSAATTLTGPVCLFGSRVADSVTYQLGQLNQGSDVTVAGTATGYAEKLAFVGVFDYLTVGGCTATITPSNSATVTVKVMPVD